MLLFLDVVSPIPEFFIIEDNKLIFQRKIIVNESEKLSDKIDIGKIETKIDEGFKRIENLFIEN